MTEEKELEILENIYLNKDSVRQRDLAKMVGLSLGMTNSILKQLVKKGWLLVQKVNNRNIRYIVSPDGIDAITRKSYRFFKRTVRNVVIYKDAINTIVKNAKDEGYSGVLLIGKSDLDFIVEHSCRLNNIRFIKDDNHDEDSLFRFYAESYIPDNGLEKEKNTVFMQSILM